MPSPAGCASRRHFLERAEQEMLRAHRYGGELAILGLDLDHFKAINDQYGHHSGDMTLKKLVSIAMNCYAMSTSSAGWEAKSSPSCCRRPAASKLSRLPSVCAGR